MGKYEKITPDELVDEELLGLGVKFEDHTKEIPADAECEALEDVLTDAEILKHNRRCRAREILTAASGLVAADGLMIYMCMAGKIELLYGLVFLAAASAFFGGRVKYASL